MFQKFHVYEISSVTHGMKIENVWYFEGVIFWILPVVFQKFNQRKHKSKNLKNKKSYRFTMIYYAFSNALKPFCYLIVSELNC